MTPSETFIRRDEHPTMPVVYRWVDGKTYRCSEAEWSRMKVIAIEQAEAKESKQ